MPHRLTLLLLLGAIAPATFGQVRAPVVDTRPFYREGSTTELREVCERRRSDFLGGRGGQILGGVAGGFAGSAIGSGTGRKVATVAGAVIGSEIGRREFDRPRTRCSVAEVAVPTREVAGYDVIYEHDGRLWRTRTTEQPGATISVPDRSTGAR